MLRIVLGLAVLFGVGAGGYFLGSRQPEPTPPANSPPVDTSLLIPHAERQLAQQPETFDPVMLKMIENHFKEQADWKSGQ